MESSIEEFLERQLACELLPTVDRVVCRLAIFSRRGFGVVHGIFSEVANQLQVVVAGCRLLEMLSAHNCLSAPK